jgi:hypothetical protein
MQPVTVLHDGACVHVAPLPWTLWHVGNWKLLNTYNISQTWTLACLVSSWKLWNLSVKSGFTEHQQAACRQISLLWCMLSSTSARTGHIARIYNSLWMSANITHNLLHGHYFLLNNYKLCFVWFSFQFLSFLEPRSFYLRAKIAFNVLKIYT